MIDLLLKTLAIAGGAGAVSGVAYNLLCMASGIRFLAKKKLVDCGNHPPASILKPLKGVDPGMYENFRSHCVQDYPDYEIIFGVSDANDAAIPAVSQLIAEFPEREIRLMVCSEHLGANLKVSTLAQMAVQARHDYLLVNDSDIRVGRDYLRNVVASLLDEKNGLVTCLYRGIAAETIGSKLEAAGIATDFCPGVLAAKSLEKDLRFGLGSTLAFRRADLNAIGGFQSFVDYLADDYELGKRISETGLRVVLSREVVETRLPRYSFSQYLKHQLRWLRTIRIARFWGSLGLIFTFALVWALLAVICSEGAWWSWGLLALACASRAGVVLAVGKIVLRDEWIVRRSWLIPLRDLIAAAVWLASFAGNTVVWRGDSFRLKDGRLVRKVG